MRMYFFTRFTLLALLVAGCLFSLRDYQSDIKKGIDLEGGTELLYEIPLEDVPSAQRSASPSPDPIGCRSSCPVSTTRNWSD